MSNSKAQWKFENETASQKLEEDQVCQSVCDGIEEAEMASNMEMRYPKKSVSLGGNRGVCEIGEGRISRAIFPVLLTGGGVL